MEKAIYASKHPMVMERLKGSGMLRYEVEKGLAGGGPGAPAPFVAACHLYFNAAADFKKGIAAHGTEIMGDIPNYTDISPQIQISEIVRSTRIRKGAPWLKPVLVQAAWGGARKKNSYFQAQFLRLKARHGAKKAAIAVAASILTTVYHMLRDGTCYHDLGPEHFARRNPAKAAARLANRIRNLGYHVEIRAAA
jgi:uncharacterized protein (TIGR02118 family)